MAVSSNSNAGSTETKVGAGALSNFNTQKTDSKSNGNFSGGNINFDTSKLGIKNPFDTNVSQQPTFDVDSAFKPTLSGNLDIDLPKINNKNNNNTTYSNNSPEPTMTVDEVYGKTSTNNQPVVEKQGDYSASSNEKSNVETSTFGKQDEISVTPTSVTENKGIVGNAAIQSVEGLDFQQKDKASQEVLDSKKKRDDAEAEDKANIMRDQLKAVAEKDAETKTEAFQVGEEAASKEKAALDEATKALTDLQSKVDGELAEFNEASNKYVLAEDNANAALQAVRDQTTKLNAAFDNEPDAFEPEVVTLPDGSEITEYSYKGKDPSVKAANDARNKYITELSKALAQYDAAKSQYNAAKSKYNQYVESYNEAKSNADKAKEAYDNAFVVASTPVTASQSNAESASQSAKEAINNSTDATPEQKAQAEEALTNLENSRQELGDAAAKARSGNPADMVTYQEALKKYNENLKKAQKIGNRFTQTDFNKKYTNAVAAANDFKVKLADGTEMEYSDFATEEATKSPQYAKAMYESKATKLEDGHPILAKIERWKAEMSQTWLGSKLTFADNKVRDQFNQMAKTDMRATYAAYNNVLNDETGKYSEEQKAEASAAINQAKALMTASAALQATTGFLSSAGDSPSDGVYGTTNPEDLNAWQKILNTVDNITKIALGLGISPAANKAYQNMYYMAGDKVNQSNLLNKDWDGDGFALCQEYGNNAATGMIAGAAELAAGVAMIFNPSAMASGLDLIVDSVDTFLNGLYGVRNEVDKSQQYTQEVLEYFKEAENIAESSGNEEAVQEITNAITQIENFELKADEVGNLDNWLEGSGSNTTSNEKFNQSLTYDEWLKLIEADPVMRDYAKSLTEKKKDKDAQKDDVDSGVNS